MSGMNTADEDAIWEIRKKAGMVFQNPDNQIIGNVVEEDVGFGPENLGVPTDEIWKRVEESLTEHLAILDCIRRRDLARLTELLENHIQY